MQQAALNDSLNISGLSATPTHFCKCGDGSASTCAATDCASSHIVLYVQVNTSAAVNPLIYVPGLPKSYTLRGQAIMRVEQ
jgi:hypothetical protein